MKIYYISDVFTHNDNLTCSQKRTFLSSSNNSGHFSQNVLPIYRAKILTSMYSEFDSVFFKTWFALLPLSASGWLAWTWRKHVSASATFLRDLDPDFPMDLARVTLSKCVYLQIFSRSIEDLYVTCPFT